MLKLLLKKSTLILFVLICIGIFVWKVVPTKAEISIFNPTSCLGGWVNPQNATGQPNVSPDAIGEMNTSNSAVLLANTNADIFCGNFIGTIPKEQVPQKIILKLSWEAQNVIEQKTIVNDSFEESVMDILDSTNPNVDFTLTEDGGSDAETEGQEPETEAPSSDPVPNTESSDTPASDTPSESSNDDSTSASDSSGSSDSSSGNPSDSGGSDSSGSSDSSGGGDSSSGDSSFFYDFFTAQNVYAQEDLASTTETVNIAEDGFVSNSPFLKVSYTTDGVHWHDLGTVDQQHLRYSLFEIPIPPHSTWEDMSNIQIAVKNISSIDNTPSVYLDGMSLQITYGAVDPNKFVSKSGLYIPTARSLTENLTFQIRDNQNIQELVVVGSSPIGGVAIFNSATGALLLTTNIESQNYIIQPEYFGEGDYVFIKTNDPDTCSNKSMEVCRTAVALGVGEFIVRSSTTSTPVVIPAEFATTTITAATSTDVSIENSSTTDEQVSPEPLPE